MTLTKKQIKRIQSAFRVLFIVSFGVMWGIAAAVDHEYISDMQFVIGEAIGLVFFAMGALFGGLIRR